MSIQSLIQDTFIGKIESAFQDVEQVVTFNNVSANQWQAIISFDLDKSQMTATEKELISALLKRL